MLQFDWYVQITPLKLENPRMSPTLPDRLSVGISGWSRDYVITSLVSRPSHCPVFDCLHTVSDQNWTVGRTTLNEVSYVRARISDCQTP